MARRGWGRCRCRSRALQGDEQAALFGQICHAPGMVKNTYGTGLLMLMHTGDKPVASKNSLLTTVSWRIGNRTEIAARWRAAFSLRGRWCSGCRDGLGIIGSSSEVESLAASVPDNGGVCQCRRSRGWGRRIGMRMRAG